MPILEFNKKYADEKAKAYRDDIAKHIFDIEFFTIRVRQLQEELVKIREEYDKFLDIEKYKGGNDEKK